MSFGHKFYIFVLVIIVLFTLIVLSYFGFSYYSLPLEERFFHNAYKDLKPGGFWGHGLGILGTLCIIIGVLLYITRKRLRVLSRFGLLKHWLEFHIFLCTLGPILILFHTSFKFGGLVAVSFWSMVAVFLSGVIGRFIYIQIPHTIEGREMSLNEVQEMKTNIGTVLTESYSLDNESLNLIIESTKKKVERYHDNFFVRFVQNFIKDQRTIRQVRSVVGRNNLSRSEQKHLLHLIRHEITLNRKIERLVMMQNLFKYWHVAHLPFAFVMLVIMLIHVTVTIVLGYRWIF
ncbi:MAG: hypothetical protein ISR57_02720 [Bacteroidales bacterium]|nr:hypothetical protein [Bacteroidota bacterium]MBL6949534.1 hypothetical protein [Bacteroidales bacterium]